MTPEQAALTVIETITAIQNVVNRVCAPDDLMAEARGMAEAFASGPTRAFGGVKRLALTAYSDGMETQLDHETRSIASMMGTYDGPHGLSAFLNKQKPVFRGE